MNNNRHYKPLLNENSYCVKCNKWGESKIVRVKAINGVSMCYRRCSLCKKNADGNGKWIHHDDLKKIYGVTPYALDVIRDTKDDYHPIIGCVVCGNPRAELHHWAPRSKFSDSEKWPTSFLCRSHHILWHKVMG